MVKFFRKIRQRLLTENKFSKYLLYAFGEIVLVVIGILIALQINNYNDAQKERKELHEYLAKISNNVKQDIQVIDSIKNKRLDRGTRCMMALNNFQENEFNFKNNVDALNAFVEFYFVPNRSGYEALKNSAYLGKINGTRIDSLLDYYNSTVNEIIKNEEGYNAFIENMEVSFLEKHSMTIVSKLFTISADDLMKDPLFKSKIEEPSKVFFKDKSYQSAVARTAFQGMAISDEYDKLIEVGKKIILEVKTIIYD